jgi:hypothetical protein
MQFRGVEITLISVYLFITRLISVDHYHYQQQKYFDVQINLTYVVYIITNTNMNKDTGQ